jgi:hypothetical protein
MYNDDLLTMKNIGLGSLAIIVAGVLLLSGSFTYRYYNVWSMEMRGKATLAEASQDRQVLIEQARAEKESAVLRAEAIKIMGEAAQKYPEYRAQEYMAAFGEALKAGNIAKIIYVPTEANIPIMEANRFDRGGE